MPWTSLSWSGCGATGLAGALGAAFLAAALAGRCLPSRLVTLPDLSTVSSCDSWRWTVSLLTPVAAPMARVDMPSPASTLTMFLRVASLTSSLPPRVSAT